MTSTPTLDVVTIGRASVDLYGEQIGGRLEDMSTFVKAVGGCPANIAIAASRLGLRAALITRVGDEAMGRFIREQLAREGVDTRGVHTDPRRLTALVLLGVRDETTFPLIFMRENCADAALDEGDIDPALITAARAIVVTGTHFARPGSDAAQRKAISIAKSAGRQVVFDIDYRPNLWGLAGHDAGESRYVRSDTVSAHLQSILPSCDVVVGTEEELHIAGGSEDTLGAVRAIRLLAQSALIVVKRGPMGCVAFPGAIPTTIDGGVRGTGFPVEVYNVLGAGDAFMAGFLRGFLRDAPLGTALSYANACGAFAVSRLLCSPETPTWSELAHFLAHGASERALRRDRTLAHIHHVTTRRARPDPLRFLSIDHGLADLGGSPDQIARFKTSLVAAAARVADGRPGYGVFLDGELGREALFRAADHQLTIVRRFPQGAPDEAASSPSEWPSGQIVKMMADERAGARNRLDVAELRRVCAIARTRGREVMIEVLPDGADTTSAAISRLGAAGLQPDLWLVDAPRDGETWGDIDAAITTTDPFCRGAIVILRDPREAEHVFRAARRAGCVRGFVAGRAVFGPVLACALSGTIDLARAETELARGFASACEAYDAAAPDQGGAR